MPLDVSVVVPTRNRSALLSMTLRSVLRQRDVELEVIVVDEASTDDTPPILAAIGDDRVRVIRRDAPRCASVRRRLGLTPKRDAQTVLAEDRWKAAAATWLREFESCIQ